MGRCYETNELRSVQSLNGTEGRIVCGQAGRFIPRLTNISRPWHLLGDKASHPQPSSPAQPSPAQPSPAWPRLWSRNLFISSAESPVSPTSTSILHPATTRDGEMASMRQLLGPHQLSIGQLRCQHINIMQNRFLSPLFQSGPLSEYIRWLRLQDCTALYDCFNNRTYLHFPTRAEPEGEVCSKKILENLEWESIKQVLEKIFRTHRKNQRSEFSCHWVEMRKTEIRRKRSLNNYKEQKSQDSWSQDWQLQFVWDKLMLDEAGQVVSWQPEASLEKVSTKLCENCHNNNSAMKTKWLEIGMNFCKTITKRWVGYPKNWMKIFVDKVFSNYCENYCKIFLTPSLVTMQCHGQPLNRSV